jgi:hypothetical protein
MKTIIKEQGSTKEFVISDDMMDNNNFVTLYIQADETDETEWMEIDVTIDELLRVIKQYEKK